MPRSSTKGRVPASIFLSCSMCAASFAPSAVQAQRGNLARQAGGGDRGGDALGVVVGDEPAPRRIARGEHHAERDRFAMQQPVGKAGLRLERMAEGVAEIEQGARAGGLALVLGDDPRLGLDAVR